MVIVQKNGVILGNQEASNHKHGTRSRSIDAEGFETKSPRKPLTFGLNQNTTICRACPKLIGKENAVRCTQCKGWLHHKCTGLSKHEYEFLCNTPTTKLLFSCVKCFSDPTSPAPNQEQLNNEARFDKIEKMCQSFGEQSKEIFELLSAKKDDQKEEKKKENIQVSLSVQEAVREEHDKDEKKNNLILFNLPEFVGNEEDNDDILKVKEVLGFVKGIPIVDILDSSTVTRLGRKKEDPEEKPRAIRIAFGIPARKMDILRNAYKLANHDDFRKLGLSMDMTKKERDAEYILRGELLRRRAAGEDIKISRGKIVPRTTSPPNAETEVKTTAETGSET